MSKAWDQVTWQEIEIGGVLTEPGSARAYNTGDWRSSRPIWDKTRCLKCGICWTVCPESGISEDADGYFDMNTYCKGCGICVKECVTGCIKMVVEES